MYFKCQVSKVQQKLLWFCNILVKLFMLTLNSAYLFIWSISKYKKLQTGEKIYALEILQTLFNDLNPSFPLEADTGVWLAIPTSPC